MSSFENAPTDPTNGGQARDEQEATRRGIDDLGERTMADLRGIIEQLDGERQRRKAATTTPLQSLGPYSDLVEIGRGGMGIVYRARDPKGGGFVALKVPASDWIGDLSVRVRFLREAQIVGALDHPGILPYLDSGEVQGRCYIVGEYCDGPDLAAWLKRRTAPVPPRAAAKLVAALAEAVAHAHERGILHRDLKPSNVLLPDARESTDPMELQPRLTDFGLAKVVDPLDADVGETLPQALTRTGILLGSPPYMAPEQAAGNPSAIGPWTDVYGLGAILYEILTGRAPFRGESPTETLRQAREADPIPVRVLRAGAPRALETITLKCLEKTPARRYASAALLADDLHRFLQGRSILAKPATPRERLRRWTRRRPWIAGSIAAGLVGLGFVFSGVIIWNMVLREANKEITRERERADQNVYDSNLQLASKALEAAQLGRAQLILRDMIPRAGAVDRRDFAWGHLWMLSRREARLLHAGTADIWDYCLSPEGRRLALTNAEGEFLLLDLEDERTVWRHRWERPARVDHPAFSADGDILALGVTLGDDGDDPARETWTVELRSAETGEFLHLGAPREARRVERVVFLNRDALLGVATSVRGPSGEVISRRFATWEIGRKEGLSPRLHSVSGDFGWLEVAPDGTFYAAPGRDGRPTLYDATTNAPRLPLAEAPDNLGGRAFFSPDGGRVAMAGGGVLFVWETASGRLIHRVDDLGAPVRTAAPQPGGDAIVARETSEEVRLIDPPRALNQRIFSPANSAPGIETTHLIFSPDGGSFFINRTEYMEAPRIQLRSAIDGKLLAESPGRQFGGIGHWGFARDEGSGPPLIYNIRRYLWLWNWTTNRGDLAAARVPAHDDEIWAIENSPDGSIWATAANDTHEPQTIKLWDARSGKVILGWKGHNATVTDLDFSPDGHLLASSSLASAKPVRVWECPSGREIVSLDFPDHEAARSVDFDPSGSHLIAGGDEGTLRMWDARSFTMLWERRNKNDRIHEVAFHPRGDRVASATDLGFVRVYSASTGTPLAEIRSPGSVLTVRYDPAGRILAAGDREGSIFLIDAATNRLIRTIRSDDRQLFGLAFSPDGKTLAVGGHGRAVRLYDPETGNELLSLEGHEAQVNALTFAPDGLTLASADHEGVVFLWRAVRGPSSAAE